MSCTISFRKAIAAIVLTAGTAWNVPSARCEEAASSTQSVTISNKYCKLTADNGAITSLCLDPSGKGEYGKDFVTSYGYAGVFARGPVALTRAEGAANRVQWTGLTAGRRVRIQCTKTEEPVKLLPGHTLGQSFKAKHDFDGVTVRTPTWHTAGAQFTLTLRRENETVAQQRFENVTDNADLTISFPYQPAGKYTVTMSDAQGRVGWWKGECSVPELGSALVDGEPVSGMKHYLQVHCQEWYGTAEVSIALDGNKIAYDLTVKPHKPDDSGSHPQRLTVPWTEEGYDTSAKATPFKRFYSDAHRFFPIEQLKRNSFVDLVLTDNRWFHFDGTGKSDLTVHCGHGTMSWERNPGTLTPIIEFPPSGMVRGQLDYRMTIEIEPRQDKFPSDWPAFRTSDPALDKDLNLFHYERNLSYPSPCFFAEWMEWAALTRTWFAGPHRSAEKNRIGGSVMDEEGYVQVNNQWRGWPFPDPSTYDTRHFSTNARYILGFWRTFLWDRDEEFLRKEMPRLRKAMAYQLRQLQGETGLIVANSKDHTGRHRSIGGNYWDISPFGHLDAYCNAAFHGSLEAMAQIEELYSALPAGDSATSGLLLARQPGEYRRIAGLCREKYSSTFWDEQEGRFIGCVDADGGRHDYGFTFVNLEAMYYGLVSPDQAKRIYEWLDHGKSSTGKSDIYSAWVFAPRATTIHNPMWDEQHPDGKEGGSVKAWWSLPWLGTPFGEQCQDGGAILYTSFFDLMARTQFLGPDNAMARWSEILARYRMPDRMCGGPPLSRGENPQQLNPGSVGLDIPFPESGLVPLWFLYGVMGIEPAKEGLRIQPHLPRELEFCEASNVAYRYLPLTIRATRKSVQIRCDLKGYEFNETYRLGADGAVLFDKLPGKLGQFPQKPPTP